MFPAQVIDSDIDERGHFLCQDPDLRSKVLPLFSFDPRATDERPVGQGTAFRIDPWSRCATAFHVVEELFRLDDHETELVLREDVRLAALEISGLGYGRIPIPEGAWRPFAGSYSLFGIERLPVSTPRIRNVTELMVLRIAAAGEHALGDSVNKTQGHGSFSTLFATRHARLNAESPQRETVRLVGTGRAGTASSTNGTASPDYSRRASFLLAGVA